MVRHKTRVPTSSKPPARPHQAEKASMAQGPIRIDELGIWARRDGDVALSTGVGLFMVAAPVLEEDGLTVLDAVQVPIVASS